jgi:hypothetical protein
MFNDLIAEDQVEAIRREGQILSSASQDISPRFLRLLGSIQIEFQSEDLPALPLQPFHIEPDAAAVLQDFSADPPSSGGKDHVQPALLPGSPDIGGFSPLSSQVGRLDRGHFSPQ